jgi:hypothetical protein
MFSSPVSYTNAVLPATTGDVSYESKEVLREPYAYLLQIPGKRVRSKLIDAFDEWLNIAPHIKSGLKSSTFSFFKKKCVSLSL